MRRLLLAGAFGLAMLVSSSAFASDMKFGSKPLAVDGKGNITQAGKDAAVTELANTGQDNWVLHVWAALDGAKNKPLVVQFWGDLNGERYQVWKTTQAFDGGKFASFQIKLEGKVGFNRNREYTVELSHEGSDAKLASGKIKLTKPDADKAADEKLKEKNPEDLSELDAEIEAGGGPVAEEQDVDPSLPPATEEPPVTKSKGCTIAAQPTPGAALLILAMAVIGRRRRA